MEGDEDNAKKPAQQKANAKWQKFDNLQHEVDLLKAELASLRNDSICNEDYDRKLNVIVRGLTTNNQLKPKSNARWNNTIPELRSKFFSLMYTEDELNRPKSDIDSLDVSIIYSKPVQALQSNNTSSQGNNNRGKTSIPQAFNNLLKFSFPNIKAKAEFKARCKHLRGTNFSVSDDLNAKQRDFLSILLNRKRELLKDTSRRISCRIYANRFLIVTEDGNVSWFTPNGRNLIKVPPPPQQEKKIP
ncbi:unnamed protein product [Allacma fusca]|uniref:Uncharacterized protein n=1 Tax=Allacma fusca TaxID=39272 RepID=A0A8J2KLS2_9HEXA|nr:unnamed protein product [Allacma fusca]